eukprot:14891150-Alexandrium_andersonii.AAC.1
MRRAPERRGVEGPHGAQRPPLQAPESEAHARQPRPRGDGQQQHGVACADEQPLSEGPAAAKRAAVQQGSAAPWRVLRTRNGDCRLC